MEYSASGNGEEVSEPSSEQGLWGWTSVHFLLLLRVVPAVLWEKKLLSSTPRDKLCNRGRRGRPPSVHPLPLSSFLADSFSQVGYGQEQWALGSGRAGFKSWRCHLLPLRP